MAVSVAPAFEHKKLIGLAHAELFEIFMPWDPFSTHARYLRNAIYLSVIVKKCMVNGSVRLDGLLRKPNEILN